MTAPRSPCCRRSPAAPDRTAPGRPTLVTDLRYGARMRRLLVLFSVLAVLAVVLVAADFIGGRVFEDRAGKAIQSRLGLEQPPSVQVRDFPFLLSLARERLRTV